MSIFPLEIEVTGLPVGQYDGVLNVQVFLQTGRSVLRVLATINESSENVFSIQCGLKCSEGLR